MFDAAEFKRIAEDYRRGEPSPEYRVARFSKRALVVEIYPTIIGHRAEGYTFKGICEYLARIGAALSESTLKNYLREARRKHEGDSDAVGASNASSERRKHGAKKVAQRPATRTPAHRNHTAPSESASPQTPAPLDANEPGATPLPTPAQGPLDTQNVETRNAAPTGEPSPATMPASPSGTTAGATPEPSASRSRAITVKQDDSPAGTALLATPGSPRRTSSSHGVASSAGSSGEVSPPSSSEQPSKSAEPKLMVAQTTQPKRREAEFFIEEELPLDQS